jgi:hypothetical protein
MRRTSDQRPTAEGGKVFEVVDRLFPIRSLSRLVGRACGELAASLRRALHCARPLELFLREAGEPRRLCLRLTRSRFSLCAHLYIDDLMSIAFPRYFLSICCSTDASPCVLPFASWCNFLTALRLASLLFPRRSSAAITNTLIVTNTSIISYDIAFALENNVPQFSIISHVSTTKTGFIFIHLPSMFISFILSFH